MSNCLFKTIIELLKLKRVFKELNKEAEELSNINNILSIYKYKIINSRVNKNNKENFIFIL
jgi:hypothetical protein